MFTHRPFIFIALAFISGILIEARMPVSTGVLIAAFALCVLLAVTLARWAVAATVVFLLGVVALGAFDLKNWQTLPSDHVFLSAWKYRGKTVTVKGIVDSDVQLRAFGRGAKTSFTLRVREVCIGQRCQLRSGLVMANLFEKTDLGYGDEVCVTGKLHRPLDFSSRGRLTYRSFLSRRQVYLMLSVKKGNAVTLLAHDKGSRFMAFSLWLRKKLNRIFDQYLSPAESGLMQALITGERKDIPPHVREIYFRTGTVHILAISGMNIGMVAFGVFLFLNLMPISRRWQMALTIMIIAFYSFMAGGNSPVVRAAVTGTVFLLSYIFEREQDMLNSLAFAAFCILLFLPNQLFDVGFQLSFGSVLAIIVFSPIIMRFADRIRIVREHKVLRIVAESLAVSLSAMIGVSGMIAYYFQIVTPVAIIANLPVIPLVGIVTAIGGGLLLSGLLCPLLAPLFAVCAKVMLNLMVLVLYLFSRLPGGSFGLPAFSFCNIVIYYVILIVIYFLFKWATRSQSLVGIVWPLIS